MIFLAVVSQRSHQGECYARGPDDITLL